MKTVTTKSSFTPRKLSFIAVGFIVLVGLIWIGSHYFSNYAEKTVKPLERALVKAGAVKKLGGGDSGRGLDNKNPYYDSIFEVSKDKNAALTLISQIARDNGYSLVHASPTNRGPLGAVADIYIDNWFFDNTSKKSGYSELEDGPIELTVKLGDEDKPDSSGHTTLRVSVRLPAFKL